MDKIILSTKLSIDDFIKVNYHMLYRKLIMKFITGVGIIMLILIAVSFNDYETFPWFQLLFALFVTVGLPVQLYFSAKRNYNTNNRVSELITYEIDKENIHMIGESFDTKLSWDKVYGVSENKDWMLIWQTQQIANVLPKRDFKDNQLQAFREVVKLQSRLKNKLKK
ncbi:MAG: YcxB family protein [Bacteroidetes bacterium]|nr:YcxB family protein [Bacteroidota bacterium]